MRIRGYSSSVQNNFLVLHKLSYFSPSRLVSARWATSHAHAFSPDYWVSNWTLASFTLHGITHWRPSYLGMSHHKCEATLQCKKVDYPHITQTLAHETPAYIISPSIKFPTVKNHSLEFLDTLVGKLTPLLWPSPKRTLQKIHHCFPPLISVNHDYHV